jgi:hypothetical protein
MAARIADLSVEHHVDVVLAPTRLLSGPQDTWLAIDIETCQTLRSALDSRGAKDIAVDYPLLTPYQVLLDGAARRALASQLADLPFEYLWLRIANFGSDKSAAGLRKFINASRDFHCLEKPIVADSVGGLPALGIVAFGASGGFCHGVAEKERFYPNYWRKARESGKGGGPSRRVYFAGFDAYLNEEQARTLLATWGAKPLLGCRDTGCCPGSSRKTEDMRRVLEDLQVTNHNLSRSRVPTIRAGRSRAKSMTNGW